MNVTEFFEELLQVTDIILNLLPSKMIFEEPNPYQKASTARSPITMLILESKRPASLRTQSIIRSSWSTALAFGKEFRMFEAYRGNEGLRAKLKEFLGVKV